MESVTGKVAARSSATHTAMIATNSAKPTPGIANFLI
jgi:hypothetical protein